MSLLARLWGHDEQRDFVPFVSDWSLLFDQGLWGGIRTSWTQEGRKEKLPRDLPGYASYAYRGNSVVFAAMAVRAAVFSEARFIWRSLEKGRTGHLDGTQELLILEKPWPGATTGELLARMIQDVDLVGNAIVAKRPAHELTGRPRLKRLRPDWCVAVYGINERINDTIDNLVEHPDAEIVGWVYTPGGMASGADPIPLLPDEVAHWAPYPDPESPERGISWLTPALREIEADREATTHKAKFFRNAATPNMIVKLGIDEPDAFNQWVDRFRATNEGRHNAYKTLFLNQMADATVVGSNFQQMDFRNTVGISESRIAMDSGVPATILGTTEGMQGSSLNAGNYGQVRRRFADITMRPLWRSVCGALENIVNVPPASQLWYDAADIPALQEDQLDAAQIVSTQASAIRQLIDGGYDPDTVRDAVDTLDIARLRHTGRLSVQLQPPGSGDTDTEPSNNDDTATDRDIKLQVDAAGILIRSGFLPDAALEAVGLDPIEHTGLLPVTLKDANGASSSPAPDLGGTE